MLGVIVEYWCLPLFLNIGVLALLFNLYVDHQFHVCRQKADVEAALADWRGVVEATGVPRAQR